ncbi:MAG: hypothetical protein GXO26_08250 [Crenarchaeota archaeon]|nr:hypothetical protein [Thermoproteota archaeon]
MGIISRLIDFGILIDLVYLCYIYSQISTLAFLLHVVLLFAFSAYLAIDISRKHLVSPVFYYIYVLTIGIACGCALFLAVVDLYISVYSFPFYPLILSMLYISVAGILIKSIFNLKVLSTIMSERRRRRYWDLRE